MCVDDRLYAVQHRGDTLNFVDEDGSSRGWRRLQLRLEALGLSDVVAKRRQAREVEGEVRFERPQQRRLPTCRGPSKRTECRSAFSRAAIENRVLKAQLQGRRMRLSDDERRRLAVIGQRLGRRILAHVATVVTPDTILRWQLIARKWTY